MSTDPQNTSWTVGTPLCIGADEIHLWCSRYDQVERQQLELYRELLTEEELAAGQRFHFERDRVRHWVTRALVRCVLSRYAPVLPREWVFAPDAYGRPAIVKPEGLEFDLTFNVSHAHSLIVLGITKGPIGVDSENFALRSAPVEIAHRFFAPREAADLAAITGESAQRRFYEFWTLKEAYIKAKGRGLSIPLDSFSFELSGRDVHFSLSNGAADEAARWRFWQFHVVPSYVVAVCAERRAGLMQRLVMRMTVPGFGEEVLAASILRNSQ